MTSKFVCGAVASSDSAKHNLAMARTARPAPTDRQRSYIKEWRDDREWSQADLIERLQNEAGFPYSESQLSRVERGDQPYNQDLMEALAKVFRTSVASLVVGPPRTGAAVPSDVVDLWGRLSPRGEALARRLIKSIEDDEMPYDPEVDHLQGMRSTRDEDIRRGPNVERVGAAKGSAADARRRRPK